MPNGSSIRPEFIEMLRCPENGSRLALADEPLVSRLNQAIADRRLKNRAGQTIEAALTAALVREDQAVVYPIVHQIPILSVDEAIPLDQIPAA